MGYEENGFPIEKDRTNKQAPSVIKGVVLCVVDGELTVTWKAGGTTEVACVAGNAYNLKNAEDATIVSGTFHFAS